MGRFNLSNIYLFLFLLLIIMAPNNAFAINLLGNKVCAVYNCFISTNLIVAIGAIAIFFLGMGVFFGKVNWGMAILVALGIILISNSMTIASMVVGGNPECTFEGLTPC